MKTICFMFFLIFQISSLSANRSQIDLDEKIKYETLLIETALLNDYENLSEAYISRGETYLFALRFQDSLDDLRVGYELSEFCKDELKLNFQIRILFSMMFAFCGLENYDRMDEAVIEINSLLTNYGCENCHDVNYLNCNGSESPILGPDTVSIYDCLSMVDGTEDKAKLLASFLKADKLIIAQIAINGLADQARKCCRAGGLWKACLRPLVNKWCELNVVGIPADPSWD